MFNLFFLFNFFSLESDKVPVKFVGSDSPVGWINSEVICQSISLTPRCPSHRGVWLRGVLPIVESHSAVSCPPASWRSRLVSSWSSPRESNIWPVDFVLAPVPWSGDFVTIFRHNCLSFFNWHTNKPVAISSSLQIYMSKIAQKI